MSILTSIFSKKRKRSLLSDESSDVENDKLASSNDIHGLQLLNSGTNPVVDIVAVHGLDGHREDTWTAENGVLWLKTLLSEDLPKARVYTYGYDSRTHSRDYISSETFYGHARNLVGELTLERQYTKTKQRPIIFIAHSLGGLLVKQALVISSLSNTTHLLDQKDIQLSTYAILFFGTPHQGSDLISWGKLALRVSRIYYEIDDRLIQHMQSQSESIETGLGNFASLATSIKTKYFYETLPTPIVGGGSIMIVHKSSAVPPSTNVEEIDTRRHHLSMVKFTSRADHLYQTVMRHLTLMLADAPTTIGERQLRWQRSQASYETVIPKTGSDGPKKPATRSPTAIPDQPSSSASHGPSRKNYLGRSLSTRNEKFIGRRRELQDIHEFLNPVSRINGQRSCAVHGLGGIGKTQLVKEYFWEHRLSYTLAIWLRASDVATLAQDFADIATKADRNISGTRNQIKDVEIAREWLESSHNWLLVFDNLDSIEVFNQYQPICDHGSILITTQDPDIAATASREIRLKPLAGEDGASLLLSYLHHGDQSDTYEKARSICHELGGLPLAIVHVAGYVRQSQISLSKFLKEYQAAYSQNFADNYTSLYKTQYERTYSTVWSIALNELRTDARDFIDTLAFFSPDSVPEDIFLADPVTSGQPPGVENGEVEQQREQSQRVDDMVRHLSKRSLIERSQNGDSRSRLAIHRQLQHSLILSLSRDLARSKRIFANAVTLLRRVFPRQNLIIEHMTKDWPQCARYVDQVLSFHRIYLAFPDAQVALGYSLEFAHILCDCGQYLWEQSLNEPAEQVLRLATALCDGSTPPRKPLALRASILFRQCSVEIDEGYNGILRAIPKFTTATNIQRGVLDEMKRNGVEPTAEVEIPLANGLNNLGCCYLHLCQYAEAEPFFQQSLEIKKREKWSKDGSMAYEFAESYKNIAIVRAAQSQIQEALKMSLESVRIITEYTDPKSSRTYFFRFIYACILFDSGAIESALNIHLEILEARRKILGEAHNYTASSYYMTGYTYHHLGRLQEAEGKIQESIEIWSKGHAKRAHVARAQYLLSLILHAEDRFKEANETREEARAVLSELTGQDKSNIDENMKVYDSLVPVWNGRSFVSPPVAK